MIETKGFPNTRFSRELTEDQLSKLQIEAFLHSDYYNCYILSKMYSQSQLSLDNKGYNILDDKNRT